MIDKKIKTIDTHGFEAKAGLVSYKEITMDDTKRFFTDFDNYDNLFIKRGYFNYQNEYRIVIANDVEDENNKPADSVYYHMQRDIKDCAVMIPISTMEVKDGFMLINTKGE